MDYSKQIDWILRITFNGIVSAAEIFSLFSLVYISFGFNLDEDKLCNSLSNEITVFYNFISVDVCMFSWLRQRAF